MVIWPTFFSYFFSPELYERYIGAKEWTVVWSGAIVTLQTLTWLSTKWSVNINATFTTSKSQSPEDAKLIKVHPIENAGAAEICKLERETVGSIAID